MDKQYRILEEKLDYIIDLLQKQKNFKSENMELFLKNKTMFNFKDISTKECYDNYVTFLYNVAPFATPVTLTRFNKIIREKFPKLKIGDTTKGGKQVYLWR